MNQEKEMKWLCMAKQQTYGVSNITGRLRNYNSGGAYVHNWVKWPERESDHKPLFYVELTGWGYNSMPLHECTEHLNGCSASERVPSYHGNLNGCTRAGVL
jgi:hypothetical protein